MRLANDNKWSLPDTSALLLSFEGKQYVGACERYEELDEWEQAEQVTIRAQILRRIRCGWLTEASKVAASSVHRISIPPLTSLLSQLRTGKPLDRSDDLTTLAREVVRNQETRKLEDIEVWAQQLARDIANYVD
jgi:hypothetical protein